MDPALTGANGACSASGETQASALRPSAAALEMLDRLIAFPTVTRQSNLDLIGFVRDYLAGFGVAATLTYDKDRSKANLFATLGEGRRGEGTGGTVLSGHSDVVPVEGQSWSSDPFKADHRGGRVYGRGSADMKGFVAVVLAAAPKLLATPGEPFHIAISYDEECGCVGVHGLLDDLRARGVRPSGCIVGEPTDMRAVLGHKGGAAFSCTVEGREAHASLPFQGVNAIEHGARLIVRVQEIAARLQAMERRHAGFEPPYTTLQANVIAGGVASNVVAKTCEFRVDVRSLPWTRAEALIAELEAYGNEELLPAMRRIAPESGIVFRQVGNVPPADIDEGAPLVRHVRTLLEDDSTPGYVAFGSEAGLFARAGIPALLCGPGSISQAHKPDEFVTLEQLAKCERFIGALAASAAPAG